MPTFEKRGDTPRGKADDDLVQVGFFIELLPEPDVLDSIAVLHTHHWPVPMEYKLNHWSFKRLIYLLGSRGCDLCIANYGDRFNALHVCIDIRLPRINVPAIVDVAYGSRSFEDAPDFTLSSNCLYGHVI